MSTITLNRIEADIEQLSLADQLWLMERLAHRIRERALPPVSHEDMLRAMATDPAIQRELRQIDNEFAGTEWDGLEPLP